MAGPVDPSPLREELGRAWLRPTRLGQLLDWPILAAVLALCAGAAFQGLTFMPAAGFLEHRARLAALERATLLIGTGALARWLLGGRALPAALLWGLAAATEVCFISLVTTTDLYATREEIFFLISAVVLALAVVISITDRLKARVFLGGLALIAAGQAVIGLGQYASGESTPAYWLSRAFAGVIHTRIHGTLTNPNVLADFLLVGIGAGALLALDLPGRWRLLPGLALAVQVAALPLTYSRGGYVGLAVFMTTGGILLWRVRQRAWPVLLVIVAVAGLVVLLLPEVGLRAESVTLDPGDTAASRVFIWRTALRIWQAHRVWGAGIGAFNAAYSAYRPPGVLTTYAMLRVPGSAHNDYLELLAETGLVGAMLIALAAGWALWRVARRFLKGGVRSRIWLGVWGAALAGVCATSLVNSNLSVISNALMLVSFTAAVAAHESLRHPPLRFQQRLLALPLAVVLVGLPPLLPPLAEASALHARATAAVKHSRYAEGVDLFRAAMTADPPNGIVLPYFGDLMADLYLRRIDSSLGSWRTARDRAAELYLLAEWRDPWGAYPHAALGRLRQAEGRYDEAVVALRRSIALDPYSALYRLWMAEALLARGDRREAVEALRAAVMLYPLELRAIESHEGHGARYRETLAQMLQVRHLLESPPRRGPDYFY